MALADIRNKIESEATQKAQSLMDETRKQAAAIEAQADREIAETASRYADQLKAEAPEIKRRARIVAGLDVKRLQLGAKRQVMDDAFEKALDVLVALDGTKYLAFMERLLDQASTSGDEELLVAADEKAMTPQWLEGYNAAHGRNITLSAEHPAIRGGFILRRGKISENCSLETLVRWLREDLESDLTVRLFADK